MRSNATKKSPKHMLAMAAGVCLGGKKRRFQLGAVARRADGKIVAAANSMVTQPCAQVHAEARLCRKLDKGATVYVARVLRANGSIALARPCPSCIHYLRAAGVRRVYYTIQDDEFGCIDL